MLKIWSCDTQSLIKEFQYKNKTILCKTSDLDYDVLIASCSDSTLRIFQLSDNQDLEMEVDVAPFLFTTVLISH